MNISANWTITGIEETLLPFKNGQTLRQGWSPQCERFPAQTESDWGVLKTTAIQDGEFQPEHNKQLPPSLEPDPLLEVEIGDLLLTCAGPRVRCGVICLVRKTRNQLMISGKMYRFRSEPRIALASYLEAFLRSHDTKKRIDVMKTGISDSGLNLTLARFKTLQVPLPPLPEQRRIVAKIEELFSELDKGIENLKQARAQLAVYRQALLKHAFEGKLTADWRAAHANQLESTDQLLARIRVERNKAFELEMAQWTETVADWNISDDGEKSPPKPQKLKQVFRNERVFGPVGTPPSWHVFHLDEIVISIGQGWSPKCEGFPAEPNKWGVIKTTAIQRLAFGSHENKQLPRHLYPRPWLQILQHDILITRAGPRSRVGIVCLVKHCPEKLMLCDKSYRLRFPESVVSSAFMEMLLNSTDVANRIEALKTGINDSGVNITQSGFLNLTFPIPPLNEQIEIQRILEKSLSVVDNLEQDIETNLQKAEALRQSILKKAFAGELVPQDPADEPAATLLARIRAERAAAGAPPRATRKAVRKTL